METKNSQKSFGASNRFSSRLAMYFEQVICLSVLTTFSIHVKENNPHSVTLPPTEVQSVRITDCNILTKICFWMMAKKFNVGLICTEQLFPHVSCVPFMGIANYKCEFWGLNFIWLPTIPERPSLWSTWPVGVLVKDASTSAVDLCSIPRVTLGLLPVSLVKYSPCMACPFG